MPIYMYKVRNESGKVLPGESKYDTEEALRSALTQKGYTVIDIKEKNAFNDISQIGIFKAKVNTKDLAIFCRQFAIVIEAGVPIGKALEVLRDQATNTTLRAALIDIYESIQKGVSLSMAMKQQVGIFPELLLSMIEAGEVSGQLDKVCKRLADHFEKQYKLQAKIKSAMIYPILVCIIAVGAIGVLMWKVVPTFKSVLASLKVELPYITKVVVAVSDFSVQFWWLILLVLVGGITLISIFSKTYEGKRLISRLSLTLPVLKGVTKNIITSRLTGTLATLISSGVLLIQSLEITQKVLGNVIIVEKMDGVLDEIKKGKGISVPLENINYFPPLAMSMIKIGEESGDLDFTLEKSADFYEQEVESSVQKLTAFLEPLIMLVLGVVVLFIVLSVLLPMMSIYQTLGKK